MYIFACNEQQGGAGDETQPFDWSLVEKFVPKPESKAWIKTQEMISGKLQHFTEFEESEKVVVVAKMYTSFFDGMMHNYKEKQSEEHATFSLVAALLYFTKEMHNKFPSELPHAFEIFRTLTIKPEHYLSENASMGFMLATLRDLKPNRNASIAFSSLVLSQAVPDPMKQAQDCFNLAVLTEMRELIREAYDMQEEA